MANEKWTANYHQLFPTPLFVFKLHEHELIDRVLFQVISQQRSHDTNGQAVSNVLGWHSQGNLFALDEVKPFRELVDLAIAESAKAMGYENVCIKATNCWANVNPKHASNKIHDHANCLFSGVYYVRAPKECGNLMFYDPRSARTFYKPTVQSYTAFTADAIAHIAEAGLLLIFPSWLRHGVEPNMSDEERISVSFNYVFG